MRRLIVACLLLSVCGCSRMQHKPPTENLRQAADYINTARKWEARGDWRMAAELYNLAWENYVLSNRESQKFAVSLSLARQYRRMGDSTAYRKWTDTAGQMLDPKRPERVTALSLLMIEEAMEHERFQEVIERTTEPIRGSDALCAEMLAYRVQAASRLNQYPGDDIQRLEHLCVSLEKRLKKGRLDDPSVLSFAKYSIAYAHFRAQKPEKALADLKTAYRIDQQYELFANLADDVYLTAHSQFQLQRLPEAIRNMDNACRMYELLKLTEKGKDALYYLELWRGMTGTTEKE